MKWLEVFTDDDGSIYISTSVNTRLIETITTVWDSTKKTEKVMVTMTSGNKYFVKDQNLTEDEVRSLLNI
jgi:uncharacterized protein YlzI (FlbEa/FlbD family)